MKHYSTENYLGATKVKQWNTVVEEVFTKLDISPADPQEFHGTLDSVVLGQVHLVQVVASPAKVDRSTANTNWSRDRFYFLHLQLEGEMRVSQDGHETLIKEGSMALCDSGMAYSLDYEVPSKTLVMIVPHNEIKRKLPAPEVALGREIEGNSGLGQALSRTIVQFWNEAKDGLPEDISRRLGENLIDLFSITCMNIFGDEVLASATGASRRSHIRCHIESNLKEPDMTVTSIANAFRISPRYLHMLFSEGTETVSELIRRRRLEEIKKRLGNSNWKNRTITQLSFAWGFNNTTHFARVFREQFGMSPREYRNQVLKAEEAGK